MNEHWPGICAAAALLALLVLVIRFKVHAFVALLVVSLALGLAAGSTPAQIVDAINKGVSDILREVLLLLALGAMLGHILETSGAAELIARRVMQAFGEKNTSFAILVAAFLIGIPILFNVGFLVLIPIVWRLQRETKKSLLYFLCPLAFSLGITHSLVPPHPGIVGAVTNIGREQAGRVMVETIIFGIALSVPMTLVGWFGPGRFWAKRQHVEAPANMTVPGEKAEPVAKSLPFALLIVLAPLILSVLGFGVDLLERLGRLPEWMTQVLALPPALDGLQRFNHSWKDWLQFLGKPTIALAVPTALAFWAYGLRRGWSHARLGKLTSDALVDVGGMVFLFGAAGAFKEVIQQTRVGDYIAQQMSQVPMSPVAVAYIVAALMRIALGSATASILAASALVSSFAAGMEGRETLLVLGTACGVTISTQPADSGFWMLKEYGNVSTSDVMLRINGCRVVMSLTGVGILLVVEALLP
jgi:Gnt-I system low-affinity gluconate transporter